MLPHIIGIETAIRENRTDDETMRRIRAKQIIYAPEDGPVNGRIVALLTIRHLVIEVGAEGDGTIEIFEGNGTLRAVVVPASRPIINERWEQGSLGRNWTDRDELELPIGYVDTPPRGVQRAKAHKVTLAKVIDNPAARREFKRRRLPEKLWEGLYEVLSSRLVSGHTRRARSSKDYYAKGSWLLLLDRDYGVGVEATITHSGFVWVHLFPILSTTLLCAARAHGLPGVGRPAIPTSSLMASHRPYRTRVTRHLGVFLNSLFASSVFERRLTWRA
ncbi:hypothetical protein V8E53_000409 [Lactarius tabidus]